MFNVTFERSYKDGEEWKTTNSFGPRRPAEAGAARPDEAHSWITRQPPPRAPRWAH